MIMREFIRFGPLLFSLIISFAINISSLAVADTALNSSNWQGVTGAHYWVIVEPGTYYLDVDSPFVTTHNFAIRLNTSNIILDGKNKTISGSAIPSEPSETLPDIYGVRANAGIPSSGIQVKNLKVEKKLYGVIFEAVASGKIENVTANNNHYGIYLWDADLNTITGNTASYNIHSGIVFDADYCINTGNTVSGNTTNNNNEFGILFWLSSPNSTVTGNTANNNGNSAIALPPDSDYSTFTQNTAVHNANGMHVKSSNNVIDANTLIHNTNVGLWIESSNNNDMSNNVATNNQTAGIWLTSSGENSLTSNTCDNNLGHGIVLNSNSSDNILTNNTTNDNSDVGIVFLAESNSNIVTGHAAKNNSNGIQVLNSNNNTVTNSILMGNQNNGLWIESSSGDSITNNAITGSQNAGVFLKSSTSNTISGNNVNGHTQWGIFLSNSGSQIIFNNIFNNPSGNAGFAGSCSNNTWNTQKVLGKNIVGGPYLGGNFWGKPDGTGFSQVTDDSDGDGICDVAYALSSDNIDELPLHVYSIVTVSYVNPNDNTCGNNDPCYSTIQDAINASNSGMTIKLVQGAYAENFSLSDIKDITLNGGWDSTFVSQTNTTIIKSPTISGGSISFKEVILRP